MKSETTTNRTHNEMRTTASRKAKAAFIAALGWTKDTRSEHYKADVTVKTNGGTEVRTWRVKLQSLGWRLESQVCLPATQYASACKIWVHIKHGYYHNTIGDLIPKPQGFNKLLDPKAPQTEA